MIYRTTLAIAVALLWAPSSRGFVSGPSSALSTQVSAASTPVGVLSAVSSNDGAFPDFDSEAFEQKNAYRKKFGLKAMTEEQFRENEAQVQQLSLQQEQKKAELQQQQAEATTKASQQQKLQGLVPGFLEKMLGSDTCESNFDCENPQVCCDFGFTRKCCSSGTRQRSREGELAYVPVPVDIQDYSQF